MTKKELEKLRKNLPRGYRDLLASQFNCSTRTVDMVLAGERKNLAIVKSAIEMAIVHKEEMQVLTNQIKAI
jgi:hypothetical protein